MSVKLKSLIIIFILVILYGIYYWGVPAAINIQKRSGLIEQEVLSKTGYKISLKNPDLEMGILPVFKIKAENFSVLNDDDTEALEIEKPYIKIALIPLLFNKINITKFQAQNLTANFVFDEDSTLKLGQYPLNQELKFVLNLTNAKLNGYSVNIEDKVQKKDIRLKGKYLNLRDFSGKKHLNFSTEAELYAGQKASYINIDVDLKLPLTRISEDHLQLSGYIKDLDISDFSNYAKFLSKDKIKSLSGIINFDAETLIVNDKHKQITTQLYVKNLGIIKEDKSASIYYEDDLTIKTDVKTIKNGIEINEMKISGKGIDTFVSGTVTRLSAKMPVLDLNVTINPSKIENLLPIIPGEKETPIKINLYLLKEKGFWGDIKGNLELKGKADFPNIYGNILATNGYLSKPIPNAPKAVIKIAFQGETMDLDVTVPTSNTQAVFVKGPIEIYGEQNADLSITSTDSVDLKTTQIVLNPLHKILNFDIGPVPIMDLNGKGNINLHVIGNRQKPHGWGSFNFKETTASFLDINNMTLKNATGALIFEDMNTTFITKSATLNGKPASVTGKCSLSGVLDFDVKAYDQDLGDLIKIIKTSPMLVDIQEMTAPILSASGPANLDLKLTGEVKDVNDVVFNKNIFAKGTIELLSNDIMIKDLPFPAKNTTGKITFENLNANFNLISVFDNSKIFLEGKIKDSNLNTKITSNSFSLNDGLKLITQNIKLPYRTDLGGINASFIAKYNGRIDKIDFNNLSVKGKLFSNRSSKTSLIVENGEFEVNNSVLKLSSIRGSLNGSPYALNNFHVSKLFDKTPLYNGEFKIQRLNLSVINDEKVKNILPEYISAQFNDLKDIQGVVDVSARIKNNNLNAYTVIDDVNLRYAPKHLRVRVSSGSLFLRNDTLHLNKINAQLGEMPVFLDGKISNIYKNPNLNIYLNAKPTQDFMDQFFNNKSVYPVKLKGDVTLTSRLTGTQSNINAHSEFNVTEDSRLYYMGATIGDPQYPVKITIDNNYSSNRIRINNLQYDKIISSQNNKPFEVPQLNASGNITLLADNNVEFQNFRIKTQAPTDAKIFNIIFRKPFMKQGVFTSDLILNGTITSPKVRGTLDITSIDMPFFNSTIKDINMDFKQDYIHITSKGVILNNDIKFYTIMKNELTPPYIVESVKLELADLDINKITDAMRDYEAEAHRNKTSSTSSGQIFDLTQLVINKAEIIADKIKVRNINAKDFVAFLSLDDKMNIDVDKFKFNIADGTVNGNFKYNLLTNKVNLNVNLDRANAHMMTEALFDLKDQIYGSMTGETKLVCNGKTYETCLQTLSGEGYFKVANGKMPKLGSLEYLLKAGNLLKGGLTGLSINSLIDLITPLKTGEFESISGDVSISDGIARKINIYSKGKDLNMYMSGSYNLVSHVADMEIFGSLSKNITSVFGKVKNASLSTLLNTIPGIGGNDEELLIKEGINKIPNISNNTNIFRVFKVDIYGDINGDNYVQSFQWVK